MDIKYIYEKWLDMTEDTELKNQLATMTQLEINDAFYKDLEFGTIGLHGIMGAGTNRMNIYTVNKATQGLCNFLKSKKKSPSVAIAFDSRVKSEQFARSAAGVIAANGAKAFIYSELLPTPVWPYAVRGLECDAGIVITASHNPAEYNGYKVYGADGFQITLPMAELIERYIQNVDIFDGVKNESLEKAIQKGAAHFISGDFLKNLIDQAEQRSVNYEFSKDSDFKVVYTPISEAEDVPALESL
jgi:phosphoglucomutase